MMHTASAEILNSAADLIERDGLHKDDCWPGCGDEIHYAPGMPCSVSGALSVVSGSTVRPFESQDGYLAARDLARYVYRDNYPAGGSAVTLDGWAEDQTAETVAAAMRAAVEYHRAETARVLDEHERATAAIRANRPGNGA